MDKEAFTSAVKAHQEALFRVAYAILQNREDALDAMQESILRAWVAQNKLKDDALFQTWMTRIVINTSRSMLKKRRHDAVLSEKTAAQETVSILDELHSLPEKLRLPVVLHNIDGYAVTEVAAILRLPQSTIRGRLARARRQLRLELAGEEDRHASI